jgi:hypothetical protein
MRCLADFILDSDLCLAAGTEPLTLNDPGGRFLLVLSNAASDQDLRPEGVLSAQLLFDAASFENIDDLAYGKLGEAINCLTYATNRKFALNRLKRIVDWTPGTRERDALIYVETPVVDRAEPGLDKGFVGTAERFLAMQFGNEKQQEAMRWYRLGIQADNAEEQFSYFWFALEIAAQLTKSKEKIPSKCPRCGGALFCEKCATHPMHRPYEGEAIQQIIERVHPQGAAEIFKTLQAIRHTLMHGGRIHSVLDQLPCNELQAVNKLAFVTWQAIGFMFSNPDPRPSEPMPIGYMENFVRQKVVGAIHMRITMSGDPDNPQLADFPKVDVALKTRPHSPPEAHPPS